MNWLCQVLRLDWSLSSLKSICYRSNCHSWEWRFDIHQRVPTQIDRFKLLKSFAYRNFLFTKKPLKADVNSSDLILSVKHFLKLISFELSVLLITAEALWRLPCQWGGIIEIIENMATPFSIKIQKTCLSGYFYVKRFFRRSKLIQ